MKMNDFENLYSSLSEKFAGNQKRINIDSALNVYYGVSPDGYLRLAFRSSKHPPKIESTKLLRVTQGEEAKGIFWTSFDLMSLDAKAAFFAFCQNLVEAVSETKDESIALSKLKKRYISWKALFKKTTEQSIPKDVIQGLFGELYFLKSYMLEKYGEEKAVNAWGGPDATSKDYAVDSDWYEVKTIGASSSTVKISSLAQLTSDIPGRLVVIRVEQMADAFSNGQSSISELLTSILAKIEDETLESILLSKVSSYGIDVSDAAFAMKFDVKSISQYNVLEGFPRITLNAVPYKEITNVSYEISVAAIGRFLEE